MKQEKFKLSYGCAENISNNWRKMHHYPLRKRYKNHITYPCDKLREKGLCSFPFC